MLSNSAKSEVPEHDRRNNGKMAWCVQSAKEMKGSSMSLFYALVGIFLLDDSWMVRVFFFLGGGSICFILRFSFLAKIHYKAGNGQKLQKGTTEIYEGNFRMLLKLNIR